MKITVIDYGMGNLHSVAKALEKVGATVTVSSKAPDIKAADKIVLPGVGSFGDCMRNLQNYELVPAISAALDSGKQFLGICLGMQLLFDGSEESPEIAGIGYLSGQVRKIVAPGLKIPHIGWNNLDLNAQAAKLSAPSILADSNNDYVYFVHSYHCVPQDSSIISAYTDYGNKITASIGIDNIQATQFHPEKSSVAGLKILSKFVGA
mgnify:FL=1